MTVFGVQLNPGRFSIKEHVIITIMAGVGAGSAYATDIVAVQRVYYNQTYNFGYQWLVVMSTQLVSILFIPIFDDAAELRFPDRLFHRWYC